MSMESWALDAKIQDVLDDHDAAHYGEELLHWQEEDCRICEERIDAEITAGTRCKHGETECEKCLSKSIDADIDFQKRGI